MEKQEGFVSKTKAKFWSKEPPVFGLFFLAYCQERCLTKGSVGREKHENGRFIVQFMSQDTSG
jgi:hypothetical protein